VAPADGLELLPGQENPELRWKSVAGAASYLVELCRDRACDELLERKNVGDAAAYRVKLAPRSSAFWRVTAIAASGLDGFPSRARALRPALLISPE
jgi:hypothetical protein